MNWPKWNYPMFWLTADDAMTNAERQAFNDWREDIRLRLEALDIHAKAIEANARDTNCEEQARKLGRLARDTMRKVNETTPILVRRT